MSGPPYADQQPTAADDSENLSRLGDQFIASLNHEVRTPLSGIVGMTDLLLETPLNDEQREYVTTTKLCADQLLEMMNSALEYAALSSGNLNLQRAEFHLLQTLSAIVDEFAPKARSKGLRIRCQFADQLPEFVVGDAIRLRQALAPLLGNAVKFTRRGEVEMLVRENGAGGADRVSLVIEVRDTGIGIPSEKLRTIFDSFRQLEAGLSRSYAGMGLGLAVSRKLAAILGGEITVESEPGVGSTFSLQVPLQLSASHEPAESQAEEDQERDDGRFRVLMVDDNDVARRIVTHLLRRANYYIDCAEGGAEGIAAAAGRRYDLVIMDLQMPDVNGLEATEAIRHLPGYAVTPIIALTANYSDEFVRACDHAGFQAFLTKPVQRDELLRTIQSFQR